MKMASNVPLDILNKLERRWVARATQAENYHDKTDRLKQGVRIVPEGAKPLPGRTESKKAERSIR
jgi:hypothetical protein